MALVGEGDRAARWLAERQEGFATVGQLGACGLSRKQVRGRLKRGALELHLPGVIRVDRREMTHGVRAFGAVLALEPMAALSHGSAAFASGMMDSAPGTVHVTVVGRRPGKPGGVAVRRAAALDAYWRRKLPITTPAQTLLDLAPVTTLPQLEAMVARVLHRNLVSEKRLIAFLTGRAGTPGLPKLWKVLNLDPKLTRSGAEVDYVQLVRRAGIEPDDTNFELLGYEFDAYWRDARLAVEVDSFKHHGDRVAFERDHRRDSKLRGAGIEPTRFTALQVTENPLAVVAETARVPGWREERYARRIA